MGSDHEPLPRSNNCDRGALQGWERIGGGSLSCGKGGEVEIESIKGDESVLLFRGRG